MKFKFYTFMLLFLILCTAIWPNRLAVAVVDLLYFYATPGTTSIILSWETATEFDNAGFFIQRSLEAAGPFTTITPLITSVGDPFIGHYYQYEDMSVQIGVQYYYVLQILNADGTSDYTAPVAAIIPAPTATPTSTPTRTPTPILSPSPTMTFTPTSLATATQTITSVLPTNTVTLTLAPTATNTRTPTATLEPISNFGINFPAQIASPSTIAEVVTAENPTNLMDEIRDTPGSPTGVRVQSTLVVAIILWLAIAVFLFFVIRYIIRNEKQSS
jgi:hypothetical protein